MTDFDKKQGSDQGKNPPSSKRPGERGKRAPKADERSAAQQGSREPKGIGAARERISGGANPTDTGERGTTGPASI